MPSRAARSSGCRRTIDRTGTVPVWRAPWTGVLVPGANAELGPAANGSVHIGIWGGNVGTACSGTDFPAIVLVGAMVRCRQRFMRLSADGDIVRGR